MKKKLLGIGIACGSIVLLLTGAYFFFTYYYSQGFTCGVWVNGIYCTGYSVEEMNDILASQNTYTEVVVRAKGGEELIVNTQDIDFRLDYTQALEEVRSKQSPYKWISYYFEPCYYEVEPQVCFSEEKALEILDDALFMHRETYDIENTPVIKWSDAGYVLEDNTKGLLLRWKAQDAFVKALAEMDPEVDLEESKCYANLIQTDEMRQTYALWEKIDAFQSFSVTYQMGEDREYIDKGVVSKWILLDESGNIVFDENGDLVLNEEKVYEYTATLSEKYDTIGKERQFKTTKGDVITITFSKYGNDLDEEKEAVALIEAFYNNETGTIREPVYKTKAKCQGENDIGGTYIEVDMTAQRMYYYEDYELKLESGVVTGNMRLNHDTPAMIAPIYYMQRNRILRGEGYASFVYYWMAFYRGYGLHDATWRRESEFGTDTYLRNGSHGCVNLPKDVAAELYEYVEIGTPVITYY